MCKAICEVALALVCRDNRWLVARRPAAAHLGGLWEFPGGKVEPGEPAALAAVRELREECGVQAVPECALEPLTWEYSDRVVRLTPVICRWEAGEPQALASQECRWVSVAELRALHMPPLNDAILRLIPEDRG